MVAEIAAYVAADRLKEMTVKLRFAVPAALVLAANLFGAAIAQSMPVVPPTAVKPDPSSLVALLQGDLVWTKDPLGQQQAILFGDPNKAGPYGVAIKWPPGQFSHPHTHTTDRWAYVAKGTWWVSSSTHRDIATTYPLPQGSFGTDLANKVHWDGAKDEEVVLIVFGIGPIDSKLAEEK
ncbi:MAG: cupin domain-containing protein [Janthinobacterium lividum]